MAGSLVTKVKTEDERGDKGRGKRKEEEEEEDCGRPRAQC